MRTPKGPSLDEILAQLYAVKPRRCKEVVFRVPESEYPRFKRMAVRLYRKHLKGGAKPTI